jgi:SAM-dependent methyltransferase
MLSEADVKVAWNRNAPRWIAQVRQRLDVLRENLNNPAFFDHFLDDLKGKNVIDLGCGEGRNTRLLAGRGARMTGIDIASKMIEAARRSEREEPMGIEYRICSFTSLTGFADLSFDAAISTMAFMDSPDFDRAAQEAFRVLRPRGTLYFSVAHPCFWTRGSRWIIDDDAQSEGILTTDYWVDDSYTGVIRFACAPGNVTDMPVSIPHFPYRLETYINGLAQAGFRINRILEPRPSAADAEESPSLLGRIYRHVPVSLFFAATKPNLTTAINR